MKLFSASFSIVLLRYFLMMLLVIVGVTFEMYLLVFLALPVFLSCLMGVTFNFNFRRSGKAAKHNSNLGIDSAREAA